MDLVTSFGLRPSTAKTIATLLIYGGAAVALIAAVFGLPTEELASLLTESDGAVGSLTIL